MGVRVGVAKSFWQIDINYLQDTKFQNIFKVKVLGGLLALEGSWQHLSEQQI